MSQVFTRQPFGVLDNPRLQALASMKNRQNAVTQSLASNDKQTVLSPPTKRRAPASEFDDADSENIDPSIFKGSKKLMKGLDGTPKQSSNFVLSTVPNSAKPVFRQPAMPSPVTVRRNAISNPPTIKKSTISTSRGSPKHKRVNLLSKRRQSSSPFTRVDPPAFARSSVPFSLDAALSGTLSSYTPKAAPMADPSMPKSWFFDIYVDSAEEEATNLMEHSACVLDISSDDDCDTKRRNEMNDRGKENVPPPDFVASTNTSRSANATITTDSSVQAAEPVKKSRRSQFDFDAMATDRAPLGDLDAKDYYAPGLDANSVETVESPEKQTVSLDKDNAEFSFELPVPKQTKQKETEKTVDAPTETEIAVFEDTVTEKVEVTEPINTEEVSPENVALPASEQDEIL